MMSLGFGLLGSTALTVVLSLASSVGALQWLQGLLESSVVPPSPAAREQVVAARAGDVHTWLQGPAV